MHKRHSATPGVHKSSEALVHRRATRRTLCRLIVVGAVFTVLLIGCGRTPPPEFWTWSPEDSTQIRAIVDQWKAKLTSDFADNVTLSESIVFVPDSTTAALHKEMRENKYRQRYFPATFKRVFDTLRTQMKDSIILTKDTTVTVKLTEGFFGQVTIYTDSLTRFRKDTVIAGTPFKVYDTTFSAQDTVLTTEVSGSCERELFIERDTLTKQWQMKRLTGGGRYFSPDAPSAPYLGCLQLRHSGRSDTIVLRPDTIHYGIQRLYSVDSLLSYSVDEHITVGMARVPLLGHLWWDPKDAVPFLHLGHKRYTILVPSAPDSTVFSFAATDTGLRQIYIEIVPRQNLTDVSPNFNSTMWAIPVRVKPVR